MQNNIQIIKKDIKNITLKVKPTCEVILTAPLLTTDEHIEYILKKREDWISKKIAFYKANYKLQIKEFVSGENFKYLGKNYRLKVIQSGEECVKLQRGYIQIFIKNKNNLEKKKRLLNDWYLLKAQKYFKKIIAKYSSIVNVDIQNIRIRQMKTRWGSCNSAKSYINLNTELIKKSTYCVEYVIFHELAHLVHPNHSREFYNYLSTYMPDWKKRKVLLESKS
ncbi:MAG: M48 family metallopeptidase [Epsilonproteobacteria bacterium]|nr:M48 family metallopeptidase [Campylobacterota bacterium]